LCGITRPHFFRGVATVVTKLFHIVEPDLAVFGQKDFQQLRVIETLVRELDFPIKVLSIPVVREEDGLAMSSRNALLTKRERQLATCIHRALQQAKGTILVNTSTSQGMTSSSHVGREFGGVEDVRDMVAAYICDSAEECKPALDYVEVLNAATLKPLSSSEEENLFLGGMRKEKNKRKEQTTRPSSSSSSSCVVLIAVAVFFGSVRLIDNVTIDLT
jgi:pantoate--beta-alanine ligase